MKSKKRDAVINSFPVNVVEKGFMWRVLKLLTFNSKAAVAFNSNVYLYTDEIKDKSLFFLLFHETIHYEQQKKDKLFLIKYFIPQIIGVFALFGFFAFLTKFFLLSLIFLLFFLPWNSPYRSTFEYEAYGSTFLLKEKLNYKHQNVAFILNLFVSFSYYKMDKKFTEKAFYKKLDDLNLKYKDQVEKYEIIFKELF